MSFTAYQWAWTQPLEKDEHLIILIAMADIASEEGRLFASAGYIGELARKTERTVRRALESMASIGVLTVTDRPGTSAVIQLQIPDSFVVKVRREKDQHPRHGRPRKNPGNGDGKPRTPLRETPDTMSGEPIREPTEGTLEVSDETNGCALALIPDEIDVDIIGEGFKVWWATYPKRQGKKPAEAAFRVAVRKLKPMGSISVRLDFLISMAQVLADHLGDETHFAAAPERWLRQEKWNDELAPRRRSDSVADPGLARRDVRNAALFDGAGAALDRFRRERGSDPFAGR